MWQTKHINLRLLPTQEQEQLLQNLTDCVRFVY
ncbi:helix-turn-helix domain-containing protein, partial [Bacillus smithii]